MSLTKTILKTYRFDENTVNQLAQLKKYRIKESDFVRSAIIEKLKSLPIIKETDERIKLPF